MNLRIVKTPPPKPRIAFHDVSRDCALLEFVDPGGTKITFGGLMPRKEIDRIAAIMQTGEVADFPWLAFNLIAHTSLSPDAAKLLLGAAVADKESQGGDFA